MNHLAVIPLADNVLSNSYLKYFCTVREQSLIESQFDNFFSQKKNQISSHHAEEVQQLYHFRLWGRIFQVPMTVETNIICNYVLVTHSLPFCTIGWKIFRKHVLIREPNSRLERQHNLGLNPEYYVCTCRTLATSR